MTSYLAIKQGLRFNAAAVLAGIPDLLAVDKKRPDMQKVFDETIPKISSDRKKALQSRSAIYWPEKITTPLLLIHGVKDDKAPIESVLEFVKKLYLLNKPHKLVTFPNSGHHFEQNREELGPHVLNWFKEWSKN
jgi:dipeptidyl aminopeptidase/acylaminoacyl peptidase